MSNVISLETVRKWKKEKARGISPSELEDRYIALLIYVDEMSETLAAHDRLIRKITSVLLELGKDRLGK